MKYTFKYRNRGFSLVELIVVVAIMAVLTGILVPTLTRHIHKSRVTTDWENLRSYFSEIEADFASTSEYNPAVPTDVNDPDYFNRREIHYLDGHTAKMKTGYFSVSKDSSGYGYQIAYYCDKCLTDWDKHSKTCELILGANN
ncbi:MAG: type II secretion system protein [Lachnospiraceae bacterium]|nr:type II secretion system protein [Lachnospiraceae bacterium]